MQCDIIIPVWNQLDDTKDCIASIIKNTDNEYRLIIIDNASEELTRQYLESLKDIASPNILLIRNEKNLGFIKAINQGIRSSSAPLVCLLNNDTLVSKNWLKEMIFVINSSSDIGIVNPSSNNLGQKLEKDESIEIYAQKLTSQSGKSAELGAALGFCMLIKKELIEKIGLFDEVYGMGNFEDTDFSRRAIKAGYRCVRSCAAYVYHRQNISFRKLKTYESDFIKNRKIFESRWGTPQRIACVLDLYDVNTLKKINDQSLKLAREGNWIYYYSKESPDIPPHSNIILKEIPRNFYLQILFKILFKKKRFNEIWISNRKFGRILEKLSFLHKARIQYY